ncbi:MAG: hypothetical protein EZS26_003037 [Candidatus Ordinivivax streblomastigis]|uniref:Uncharacterized protein n=1 Tax=Candidatus Ordinivivax streblomastigis TaxID=2540710 RepID=A0A5M8NWN6_9BACT|nr:MAG: hypothetical protein EZS26_003037 [Candidatus Ordinivivax streblomastigis]
MKIILIAMVFSLMVVLYASKLAYIQLVKKHLKNEEWLPIVNESGGVYGKITRSLSLQENKYYHPVIRIALMHKGKLFLKASSSAPDSKSFPWDYPLARYLKFNESLEDGVSHIFNENNGKTSNLSARFIVRYIHQETKQMIYLYICNIAHETQLGQNFLNGGKWWTPKQISENLSSGIFSNLFENEYNLVSSTVLAATRLMYDWDCAN